MGLETAYGKFNFQRSVVDGRSTVVLLGDSFSSIKIGTMSVSRMPFNNFFIIANNILGQRFYILNYAGIGGDTVADAKARFIKDVIAHNPGYVFMMIGADSFSQGVPTPAVDVFADWKWMVDLAVASGITPIVMPSQPSPNISSAASMLEYSTYNWYVKEYANYNSGIIYIDPFRKLLDQSSAFPAFPALLLRADLIHPNFAGNIEIAKEVASQLDTKIPVFDPFATHSSDQVGLVNGVMNGVGGTDNIGTAQAPDGWSLDAFGVTGATSAKVARTDSMPGEWVEVKCTGSAAYGDNLRTKETAVVSLANYGFAVGDIVQAFFEYDYDPSPVQLSTIYGAYRINATVNITQETNWVASAEDPVTIDGASGVMATMPVVITPGATSSQILGINGIADDIGASFGIRIGRTAVRKISHPLPIWY